MSSSSSSNVQTTSFTMITTPTTTFMTSVSTTVPTTITSIDPYGSTITITTEISTTTSIPVPTPTCIHDSTSSVIVLIGVLLLYCFYPCSDRRRDKLERNLDPSDVVSHPSGGGAPPQVDLGDEIEVTPYPDRDGSMPQYRESPFFAAGASATAAGAGIHRTTPPLSSPSQHSDAATSPGEGYPSQGFVRSGLGQYLQGGPNTYALLQQTDLDNPRPLTRPAPSVSNTSSGREMNDQEAAAGRQGLALTTQQEVDGEGSGVEHHDAGQAQNDEGGEEPRDVPPAYESIRP
ncbi:hypothetical protein DEU56DRAFT_159840 [Suillus clintonianus]|uniref:uncharacterized protein n=1 Tax=Suillus clintonianus TaxID=1904413 RepID=UPI001B871EC5|nr:uncharacterized protein DEU56DRAFT_159840 [Suillus clintonianus]KAG2117600.1 hypothetical protein DEU56DRAFT_159840 [Suillus clintonianus]